MKTKIHQNLSTTTKRLGVFLIVLLLLNACSVPMNRKSTSLQTHMIQVPEYTRAASSEAPGCLTLRINKPTSSPGYLTARMAYIVTPNQLDYFAYHEWVDTPAKMLATVVEEQIESTNMFKSVLSESSEVKTNWRLDTTVIALHQNFMTNNNSQSILKVKAVLVDVRNRTLIASKSFPITINATAANPEAGVTAANLAAETFSGELIGFVRQEVNRAECTDE